MTTTEIKTQLCKYCNQQIDFQIFHRHTIIHEVGLKYTDKELLANIALTLTEIKSKLDTLITVTVRR